MNKKAQNNKFFKWGFWVMLVFLIVGGLSLSGVLKIDGLSIGVGEEELDQTPTPVVAQEATEAKAADVPQTPAGTCPSFTIGTAAEPVTTSFRDADDPKAGIASLAAEILDMGVDASDPLRIKKDNATTDANGDANFVGNRIKADKDYQLALRGGTTVYDYLVTVHPPCLPAEVRGFTFDETFLLKRVGTFKDVYSAHATNIVYVNFTSGNVYDGNGNIATGLGATGPQYVELSGTNALTIGEADAGERLKDPILSLRSVEGKELRTGMLKSMYLTRETGTDFGIPAVNLISFVDAKNPISLLGSFDDPVEGANYMIASDSGNYALKMTVDADEIVGYLNGISDKQGVQLRVALDDLGDYREGDSITGDLKAATAEVLVVFEV